MSALHGPDLQRKLSLRPSREAPLFGILLIQKKFPKEFFRVDKGIRTLGLQSHNLAR